MMGRLFKKGFGLRKFRQHKIPVQIDFAEPKLCGGDMLSRSFLVQLDCLGRISGHAETKFSHMRYPILSECIILIRELFEQIDRCLIIAGINVLLGLCQLAMRYQD